MLRCWIDVSLPTTNTTGGGGAALEVAAMAVPKPSLIAAAVGMHYVVYKAVKVPLIKRAELITAPVAVLAKSKEHAVPKPHPIGPTNPPYTAPTMPEVAIETIGSIATT